MNEPLSNLLELGCVLARCKSGQTLLEYIYFQRVIGDHNHVYSKVVLQSVYQMGISDILTHQVVVQGLHFSLFGNDFNPPPACLPHWFHYPQVVLPRPFPQCLESLEIRGKDIRIWHKVVFSWKPSPHFLQHFVHIVLAAQEPAPRKVADLLVSIHRGYSS